MTLSETLHSAVDEHVDLDLSAVHQRVDRRRRRRTRARAAGGAMGAALLLVGVVALAAGAGDQRPDVVAEEGAFDPSTTSSTTSEVEPTTEPVPSTEPTTTTTTEAPTTTSTEPAPTTTTEPAPTTEPPTTTTAPSRIILSLKGTYVVETGTPSGVTCAAGEMRVGLTGAITASDGATWQRAEEGCATVVDWVYRGEGAAVLTAPDGSTLTGTFLSVAQLPTTGVPYSYEITGGTGAYAGAIGTCDLSVVITSGAGGLSQTQEGEIACTATVPG